MLFDKTSEFCHEHTWCRALIGTAGGLVSTFFMYLGAAYMTAIADATTPGLFDTESMAAGVDTVEGFIDVVFVASVETSHDSSPALPGTILLSPLLSSSPSSAGQSSSENEDPMWIAFIFKKDAVPYNYVEKKAERVFWGLHKKQRKSKVKFPIVFAEANADYYALKSIYGHSFSSFINNLDILEASLEKGCGQSN